MWGWGCGVCFVGVLCELTVTILTCPQSRAACNFVTMEAGALYNFDASGGDELSFRKGDVLKVVGSADFTFLSS